MRAPSSQVALTHVRFAAESRHIADCVGRSVRPPGRKVVVLHGPLLKILVDDLRQANSCIQQLLLHDRQRVLDVDAGDVVAVA